MVTSLCPGPVAYPRTVAVSTAEVAGRSTPRLRGRLHEVAFFASIPLGAALIILAPGPRARLGAVIYSLALATQFGVSAAYHLGMWSARSRARMQTLDHSSIFVLIAGTYTPFCIMVLHGVEAVVVLAVVWGGAVVGIATKLYRVDLHVFSGVLYLGLGWVAVIVFPALVRDLSTPELILTISGGILYSLGALVLATHRPDPFPRTFGYHEVWHAATIAAALCLYVAILLVFVA